MLFDMMTGKEITRIPYEKDYRLFMSRMTPEEIDRIESALDDLIEGTEIQTAGWMPGHPPSFAIPLFIQTEENSITSGNKLRGLSVMIVLVFCHKVH